jgi:hypothetical protein
MTVAAELLSRLHVDLAPLLLLLLLLQRVEPTQREWISYYKPNLTIALVDHFQAYPKNAIPPQVSSTGSSMQGWSIQSSSNGRGSRTAAADRVKSNDNMQREAEAAGSGGYAQGLRTRWMRTTAAASGADQRDSRAMQLLKRQPHKLLGSLSSSVTCTAMLLTWQEMQRAKS